LGKQKLTPRDGGYFLPHFQNGVTFGHQSDLSR
jgi:hypothetical protein